MDDQLKEDIRAAVKYVLRKEKEREKETEGFYQRDIEAVKKLSDAGFFKTLSGSSILKFYEKYRDCDEYLYINETDREGNDPVTIQYSPVSDVPTNTWAIRQTSLRFGEIELRATTIVDDDEPYCGRRCRDTSRSDLREFVRIVNSRACDKRLASHSVNVAYLKFGKPYDIEVYDEKVYLFMTTNHPFVTVSLTIRNLDLMFKDMNDPIVDITPMENAMLAQNGSFIRKNGNTFFIFAPDYHELKDNPKDKVYAIYVKPEHKHRHMFVRGSEKFYFSNDASVDLGDLTLPSKCNGLLGVSVSKIFGTPLPSRYLQIMDYLEKQ